MENALNAIERSKSDTGDTFRRLLHSPDAHYDAVRPAIEAMAVAAHRRQVLEKPTIISRFVRLALLILEHKPHTEHLNCTDWSVLAAFLVTAYTSLKRLLSGIELVKSASELFNALSLLVKARESCCEDKFAEILEICTDFINTAGQKETSCHPYIMTCVRVLVQLGHTEAQALGEFVLGLGKARNQTLAYEMFAFACLQPQPFSQIEALAPRLIEGHEIEFVPSPEFSIAWFRPSGEADLTKFVAARAMAMASEESSCPPALKKVKRDGSDHRGLEYMSEAFRGLPAENVDEVAEWLSSDSQGTRADSSLSDSHSRPSLSGSWRANSPSLSMRRTGSADDPTTFWTFVRLAQSARVMSKTQEVTVWNLCLDYLSNPRCSSGACFCLAQLVSSLMLPENIDSYVLSKVRWLLNTMGSSSHPALTSGSLVLYNMLYGIKVLDDDFQKYKIKQLKAWLQSRIRDGQPRLVTHFLAYDCPPAYLQSEIAEDLASLASFTTVHCLVHELTSASSAITSAPTAAPARVNATSPIITTLPSIQVNSLRDSLWMLALLAKAGHKGPPSTQAENDAFTEEDLQAIVWFSNLANYFQWNESYCKAALSLASWDSPAREIPSVSRAVSLLQLPGLVVSSVISGYIPASLGSNKNPGAELRRLEPFLQSYSFQRSPWFLENLTRTLEHDALKRTNERAQLFKFLVKIVMSQSPFSPLRLILGRNCSGVTPDDFISLAQSSSTNALLEILKASDLNGELLEVLSTRCDEIIDQARKPANRSVIALVLAQKGIMSLAQLLTMTQLEDSQAISLSTVCDKMGVHSTEILFKNAAVPLYFTSYGQEDPEPATILSKLGSPRGVIERAECFMLPFQTLRLELADGQLEGIVEQLLKDVSYSGADAEIAESMRRACNFLKAHRSSITDPLLSTLLLSCCASIAPGASNLRTRCKSREAIESIVRCELKNRKPSDLFCDIAGHLNYCGLELLAHEVLSWITPTTSPISLLCHSLRDLRVGNMSDVFVKWCQLDQDIAYEISHMLIKYAIRAVETAGVEKSLESCNSIDRLQVENLLNWTSYLTLDYSPIWMAFLSKLTASRELSTTEIAMETSRFCHTAWLRNTMSFGIEAFYDVLLQVYGRLPYQKKWKLHPYFQRNSGIFARGLRDIPDDVFGRDRWQAEVEFRPTMCSGEIRISDELMFLYQYAEKLADCASQLMGIPPLGPHMFQEIPELIPDALPYLVAAYYSSSSFSGASTSDETLSGSAAELGKLIANCFTVPETIHTGLKIVERCYKQSAKSPVPLQEVVEACQRYSELHHDAEFHELGILFAELIWNEAPRAPLPRPTLEGLRFFYSSIPNSPFKDAIPDHSRQSTIFEGVKRESAYDSWKKLELDMVQTEALALPGQNTLDRAFQDAGLWRIANKIATEPKYYDFERAWWLHQWDTISTSTTIDPRYFQNRGFGLLIGFFTGTLNEQETFGKLLSVDSRMLPIFEDILNEVPIAELDAGCEELSIIRRGREIMLSKTNTPLVLAKELKAFCGQCRATGDLHRSLEYAIKLDRLAGLTEESPSVLEPSISTNIRALSCVENATLEWELGKHSAAIERLKTLVSTYERECSDGTDASANSINTIGSRESSSNVIFSEPTGLDPQLVDLGVVYSTIGTWSRAARNEPDSEILSRYFLKAEKAISTSGEERLYHEFARFCDDACHDDSLETSIKDSERVKQNQQHQVDYLSKAIQAGTTDKAFQHRYRLSLRMLKSETEDLEELKQRRMDLTLRCIRSYLLSLRAGDTYEEDMDRFIALWLSLSQDGVVSQLVHEQFVADSTPRQPDNGQGTVLVRKIIPWMNQLTSRLTNDSSVFQRALSSIIEKAIREHPHHCLWQLINILRTKDNANYTAAERKAAVKTVLRKAAEKKSKLFAHLSEFAEYMVQLGGAPIPETSPKQVLLSTFGSKLNLWWTSKLPKLRLPVPTASLEVRADAQYADAPQIAVVHDGIDIAGGISAPKIITVVDSEGTTHKMVLKGSEKDDMRQDAIMQQVFGIASRLLSQSSQSSRSSRSPGRSQRLRVRTYNVVPLGGVAGAIEFVRNTKSLQEILEPLHMLHGGRDEYSLRRARRTMHAKRDFNRAVRIATYEEVMEHTQPQMRRFWLKRFRDPHDWLEAKTAWSRSTAVTSILGYIVGLGDRHCSNLLVDTKTGEVVHIDLGIAFDQGKQLYVPETVPFRLTRDMVDGMGIPGTSGVFMSVAETTLQLLREQRDRIMMVLEVLKHDALYTWRLPPIKLNRVQLGSDAEAAGLVNEVPRAERGQAEQALRGVRQKLTASLSSEATVRDLVAQATNVENLALIFSGWSPFY